MTPRATYRLQFHAGFTFADAEAIAPYLAALGISHVYASPIATARAGSTHGYDVIDPGTINPALGGEAGFRALAATLAAHGIGIVLDIVPNHMAVGGDDNRWWLDVLEKGEASAYARHFDIDWSAGKLLAPFLGKPYAQAIADGDVTIEARDGRLAAVAHGTHLLPIRAEDQDAARALPPGDLGALHALLDRQHWRLAWWRTAGDAINWRRFFDITELAGLRVEDEAVFRDVHALPLRLLKEGLIAGVRVDHVDGLADPAGYCRRLRSAIGPEAWLVVEKILGPGEALSADWGTDGTSGYDFMEQVAALLHDPAGEVPLGRFWAELSGRSPDFAAEEHRARIEILERSFAGQIEAATDTFAALASSDLATRDVTRGALRRALVGLLSVFPVYRTYGTGDAAPITDAAVRDTAVARASASAFAGEAPLLRQVADWLGGAGPGDAALRADAVRRFQQLSAPVSAKAVEDTAFYRYGRLLSRTDVGFDPARFAMPGDAFLSVAAARGAAFPNAMLATATHDHKRGEDVRARLAVLSERTADWIAFAEPWLADCGTVARADGYGLLQTLVGAWPPLLVANDAAGIAAFGQRVGGWQEKALREAKLRSSWVEPDAEYEAAARALLDRWLGDAGRVTALVAFVDEIAAAGAANALVQAALRLTLPGVPDTYQGCEYWDFSLVDPDNRRPVDFAIRAETLAAGGEIAALAAHWRDGHVKQRLIADLLDLRKAEPALFADPALAPIAVSGTRAAHVLAFRRGPLLVAVALRLGEALAGADAPLVARDWWGDTAFDLDDRLLAADLFAGLPYAVRRIAIA